MEELEMNLFELLTSKGFWDVDIVGVSGFLIALLGLGLSLLNYF